MVVANVRGIHIYYEVVGQSGPWIAFMPGGRKPGHAILSLAEKIASAGYRVLLHDRRNCGASDVAIEGDQPEYEIWADDLYELLKQLNAFPAIIGGSSSGARTALVLALKYPEHIRALLLMRVTGGSFACTLLAEDYYGQFIRIAEQSGMAGICDTDHFAGCIAARPVNRERLMSMDAAHFIAVMQMASINPFLVRMKINYGHFTYLHSSFLEMTRLILIMSVKNFINFFHVVTYLSSSMNNSMSTACLLKIGLRNTTLWQNVLPISSRERVTLRS
jgi:pimeloyl-ACP methyl ester carboxylesterase